MTTLKSFMTDLPPINATPIGKHLDKIEMAAKLGKKIPHPAVQKAAYAAELGVKLVKKVDAEQQKQATKKSSKKNPAPEQRGIAAWAQQLNP